MKLISQHRCGGTCRVLRKSNSAYQVPDKSNLFQVLDRKVVLALTGPLKVGWSENVMVPVLFLDLVRKVVLTLTGPLKSGLGEDAMGLVLFQHRCRTGCQVLHKSDLFLQHSRRAVCQVLNESNLSQQHGCRADCQTANEWKLLSQHCWGVHVEFYPNQTYSLAQLQSGLPSSKHIYRSFISSFLTKYMHE